MKNKIFSASVLFFSLIFAILFFSCGNLLLQNENNNTLNKSVSFNIEFPEEIESQSQNEPSGNSRMAAPDFSHVNFTYTYKFDNDDEKPLSVKNKNFDLTIKPNVTTLTIFAYVGNVPSLKAEYNFNAGGASSGRIKLVLKQNSDCTENGSIDLPVAWDSNTGIANAKYSTFIPKQTSPLNDGKITLELDSGSHDVLINFYKSSTDTTPIFSYFTVVNVYSGLTTSKWNENVWGRDVIDSSGRLHITKQMVDDHSSKAYFVTSGAGTIQNGSYYNPYSTVQAAVDKVIAQNNAKDDENYYSYYIYVMSDMTADENKPVVDISRLEKPLGLIIAGFNLDATTPTRTLKGNGSRIISADTDCIFHLILENLTLTDGIAGAGGGIYTKNHIGFAGKTKVDNRYDVYLDGESRIGIGDNFEFTASTSPYEKAAVITVPTFAKGVQVLDASSSSQISAHHENFKMSNQFYTIDRDGKLIDVNDSVGLQIELPGDYSITLKGVDTSTTPPSIPQGMYIEPTITDKDGNDVTPTSMTVTLKQGGGVVDTLTPNANGKYQIPTWLADDVYDLYITMTIGGVVYDATCTIKVDKDTYILISASELADYLGLNSGTGNYAIELPNTNKFTNIKTALTAYPSGSVNLELRGDNIGAISPFAFDGCTSLTSVMIPDSVTSIGNSAFYNCTLLTSVMIPDSVTSIGNSAFEGCTSLTSVNIPDSVTSIGNSVFRKCESLTSVMIPDSVTSIGDHVFYDCKSLISVTISDRVTSIGHGVFKYCYSLTSVTIPNSVTSIWYGAFENCTSLASVIFEDPNEWYINSSETPSYTESIDVSVPSTNATNLKTDGEWANKYLHKKPNP